MTLYIIGLGLSDEKDITVKGLEAIRKCEYIYLENYTSLLQCTKEDLEEFYGKKIIMADRSQSEQGSSEILEKARDHDTAFLVVGDPLSATTHIDLFREAKEQKVPVKVIHNASILTAVGITGLQLYKFGKTTSIPFIEDHPQLETPYNIIKENKERGAHTLCLLDLKPGENRFLTIPEALQILETIEERKKESLISDDLLVVGCARLGSTDPSIRSGTLKEIKKLDFGKPPYCLIIPGKLHFVEEEMLNQAAFP
ncbi:diphthine synthase [Candidatus Woesearchaeota archaeon CG10_big_fil_rev_8_21_14_0_10_45_16]|nr:MAG: diphthine synthase [Candidatus Woesearchaeota archaeon CG10_big_fil_rev_8_21_14_0_10_45_16]